LEVNADYAVVCLDGKDAQCDLMHIVHFSEYMYSVSKPFEM